MKKTLPLLALLGWLTIAASAAPRVNHIAFYVLDLKVSTDFYANVVGLPQIPEPFHDGKHTWFALGPNCALHVIWARPRSCPRKNATTRA